MMGIEHKAKTDQSSYTAYFDSNQYFVTYFDDTGNGTADRAEVSMGIYASGNGTYDVNIDVFQAQSGNLIANKFVSNQLTAGTTQINANISSEILYNSFYTGNITVQISGWVTPSNTQYNQVELNPLNYSRDFNFKDFELPLVIINRTEVAHNLIDINNPSNGLYDIGQIKIQLNVTRPVGVDTSCNAKIQLNSSNLYWDNVYFLESSGGINQQYQSSGIYNITLNTTLSGIRENQLSGFLQYELHFSWYDHSTYDYYYMPSIDVGNYSINYQNIDTAPQFYEDNSFHYNFTDSDGNGLYDNVTISYNLHVPDYVQISSTGMSIFAQPTSFYDGYLGEGYNYTVFNTGNYTVNLTVPYDMFYNSQYSGQFNGTIYTQYSYPSYGLSASSYRDLSSSGYYNWTQFDQARVTFDLTSEQFHANYDQNTLHYSIDLLVADNLTSAAAYSTFLKSYTDSGGFNQLGKQVFFDDYSISPGVHSRNFTIDVQSLVDSHYTGYIVIDGSGTSSITLNNSDTYNFRLQQFRSNFKFDYRDWTDSGSNSGPSDNSSSTTTTTSTSTPANNSDGAITAPSLPVSSLAVGLAVLFVPLVRVVESRRRKN